MLRKKIIISLICSLIITFIVAVAFSKSLFFNENKHFAFEDYSFLSENSGRYSEEELEALSTIVTNLGYTVEGNFFIKDRDQAALTYYLSKKNSNHIEVRLKEATKENLLITVKCIKQDEDKQIVLSDNIVVGETFKSFDFIQDNYDKVVFEIGEKKGTSFLLDRIIIGNYITEYNTYLHILYLQLIFFSLFGISVYFLKRKWVQNG